MVNIFVQPGTGPERNQRAIEYDTVSDTYLHRLQDEILPVVAKSVKMRTDGYSRAIQGLSSGGIVAFNPAFTQAGGAFAGSQLDRKLHRAATIGHAGETKQPAGIGTTAGGNDPAVSQLRSRETSQDFMQDSGERISLSGASFS